MSDDAFDRAQRGAERGQALVEFSLGILVFLLVFIGIMDLARGVFVFNGVGEAAREIARVTSVHPGTGTLGSSSESAAAYQIQRNLVPGLATPTFACYDIAGGLQTGTCQPGDWVRVTTSSVFRPTMPLLALLGPFTFTSSSSAEIQ
jgi:Flp pilus assembly protein TadG